MFIIYTLSETSWSEISRHGTEAAARAVLLEGQRLEYQNAGTSVVLVFGQSE